MNLMSMQRWLLVLFLFSAALPLLSQQDSIFRHELSFVNENDAYLFRKHDAYYTNGVFLSFRRAAHKGRSKRVMQYEIGQKIYTPLIRKTQTTADIDRPYCGFLYGSYGQSAFSDLQESVLRYHITLGVVGDASLGEDLQNGYHTLFGYGRFTGWQYQVRNALGLDLGMAYARTVWEDSSWIKLVPQLQGSLGMNYTNASAGMYVCLGAFEQNRNSALWNASVQPGYTRLRRKQELFFYWYPEIIVQGYNATVQGGLISKGQGAVLAEPNRLMFRHTAGACYATRKLTLKLGLCFEDREAVRQKNPQQYGSLMLAYRMK